MHFFAPFATSQESSLWKTLKHLSAQEDNFRHWLEAFSGGTQNSANSCKLCLLSRSSSRSFDLNPQYLSLAWCISTWKEYLDWLWPFSCLFLYMFFYHLFFLFVVFVRSVVVWRSKPNLQISPEAEHEVVAAHEELMASRGLKLWNRLRGTAAMMKPLRWNRSDETEKLELCLAWCLETWVV